MTFTQQQKNLHFRFMKIEHKFINFIKNRQSRIVQKKYLISCHVSIKNHLKLINVIRLT